MKAEEIIELFQQFEAIATSNLKPLLMNTKEWNAGVQENSLPYWVMLNGVTSRIS